MIKSRITPALTALSLGLALTTGCATGRYADGPYIPDRSYASDVRGATVIEARPVTLEGSDGSFGAQTGALTGAIIASSATDRGHHGSGNPLVVLGAAILGGFFGAALEKSATSTPAVEYLLELEDDGSVIRIVQEGRNPVAPVGARVSLIYADRVYVDYP